MASPPANGNIGGKMGNIGEVTDITKELLVGSGSINISAIKDIHMSFGAQIRTAEYRWFRSGPWR
jgi:hypothetical protein